MPPLLSTDFKIGIDAELRSLLSVANRLLGQLEGMSSFLPNAVAIETILLQKEALLSCQIDRINASLYDVLDFSRKTDKVTAPIKRYASAMILGLEKLKTAQYNNALLCEIHKALMNAPMRKGMDSLEQKRYLLERLWLCQMPLQRIIRLRQTTSRAPFVIWRNLYAVMMILTL